MFPVINYVGVHYCYLTTGCVTKINNINNTAGIYLISFELLA